MDNNESYFKKYTVMMSKLNDEILEKDFGKSIPWCTNIQYDEMVVDEVVRRYKEMERSNNRLLVLSSVSLFIIMILLLIILIIL